jgi:hypothetical protein
VADLDMVFGVPMSVMSGGVVGAKDLSTTALQDREDEDRQNEGGQGSMTEKPCHVEILEMNRSETCSETYLWQRCSSAPVPVGTAGTSPPPHQPAGQSPRGPKRATRIDESQAFCEQMNSA